MHDLARTDATVDQSAVGPAGGTDQTMLTDQPPVLRAPGDPQFAPPTEPGDLGRLGRYRVFRRLGAGGMGAVYLGRDDALGREVALKVMLPAQATNPDSRARFLREARTAAAVKSDHIVTIFDVGDTDGHAFIAMERLSGASLERILHAHGDGPVPTDLALRIARETAQGLAAAHARGVVHRDIKPANIWLEAPSGRVKLLDFGLARGTDDVHLTGSGTVVGTPAYMSPEQGRGTPVDHRSDLFSVGVVLYRLVTGRLPFSGSSTMAVLTSLAIDTPPAPGQFNAQLPAAVDAIATRLLAKNPADRFQTAQEVVEALRDVERSAFGPAVVPLAERVESPDVWEGLATTEVAAVVAPSAPRVPAVPVRRAIWMRLALVLGGLVTSGALLAGLLVHLSTRAKPDPTAAAPNTTALAVSAPRSPVAKPADASERRAAEYIIGLGGSVVVADPDREIRSVADLPKGPFVIKSISSGNINVTDTGLAVFKDCTTLTGLDLNNSPVTDAGLVHFRACKNLTVLNLSGAEVSDAGLAHFAGCHDLEVLELSHTYVSDAGLVHFKGCAKLASLSLSGERITDAGLGAFNACPRLTRLNLTNTAIGDAGLAHLRASTELRHVTLTKTAVTDAGVDHLKGLSGLYELSLADTAVTDAGLAHAVGWPGLRQLFLDNTVVTDAGLARLSACRLLTDLNLSGTRVTDVGLAHLKDCRGLRMLSVQNTAVGDAGLLLFADRRKLEHINARKTRLTRTAAAELSALLPGCQIEHDGADVKR